VDGGIDLVAAAGEIEEIEQMVKAGAAPAPVPKSVLEAEGMPEAMAQAALEAMEAEPADGELAAAAPHAPAAPGAAAAALTAGVAPCAEETDETEDETDASGWQDGGYGVPSKTAFLEKKAAKAKADMKA
jgi:hypothetical protein